MFPRSISPAPKVPCEDSFPKSFKTTGSWLTPGVEPSQKPPLLVFCRALLGPSLLSTILQNLISLIIPGPSLRFKFLGLRADNQSIKLSALIESPENALFEINKDGFEGRIENFNWRTVLREYAKRFYAEKKKSFEDEWFTSYILYWICYLCLENFSLYLILISFCIFFSDFQ